MIVNMGPDLNLNHKTPFELASLEELTSDPLADDIVEEEENIDVIPDSPYKEVLKKYPELLKQSFNEDSTKNNIF